MPRLTHAIVGVLVLLCAGCTTDSPAPQAFASIPGGASLIITRPSGIMYAAMSAGVDVNGAHIADLGPGQSYSGALPPGGVTITASNWSAPGQASYHFTAEAGKAYRFVVSPRTNNVVAGAAFGIIGSAIEGGGPFQVAVEQ